MLSDRQWHQIKVNEIHRGEGLDFYALSLSTMQVAERFSSFHPNFEGEHPGGGQGPPTPLLLPTTSREDLRLFRVIPYCEGTIHLQTSMLCTGFEPMPYGTAVSVTNYFTGTRQINSIIFKI
ncbi:hypothetical protein TNCV_3937461 [Trichonephila clavipes]|nr:hypothetical protein TNCV_3937461 [Trichonephila clavipes]